MKKVLKYGCLSITLFIGFMILIGIFSNDFDKTESSKSIEYDDPLNIGKDSLKALVGSKVPYDKWEVWGFPETLEGTNNQYWVAYLDSANISFISIKSEDKVSFAGFGKESAINEISDIRKKRKESLEKQFSSWDGSHKQLTKMIKNSMNDPDSYKHVKTIYWDMETYLIVKTTFRGKNAFGGVVLNWVKAKVDSKNGLVLEIIEQG